MAKFKTIITTAGAAKIAAVLAGTASIVLDNTAKMAVGDGGGTLPTPNPAQTKLVNEVHRAPINRASIDASDPKNIVAELVIPPGTGGFWLREMALYDAAGTLLAVGNMAETYKPSLSEGAGRKMVIRMVIAVSEVNAITITMDTSTVMATQDYVDSEIDKHAKSRNHPDATLTAKGFTQLSSSTTSASETLAATPKAVKTVMDATNLKAPLASPALTGTPTAPTAAQTVSNTQIATTAFVKAAIDALINSSPGALDTLSELAAALGNDPNFATTMVNALAAKAPLASPVLTGTPTAPTAAQTVSNAQIATTAYVKAAIDAVVNASPGALDTLSELAAALGNDPNFATTMVNALAAKAPLANPALTGKPTAPTAAQSSNDTQLATTEFVTRAVAPAILNRGALPANANLNTYGPTAASVGQWSFGVAGALITNGFPEDSAQGIFEVFNGGPYLGSQRFTTKSGNIYYRNLAGSWNGVDGPWSPWLPVGYSPMPGYFTGDMNTLLTPGSWSVTNAITNGPIPAGQTTSPTGICKVELRLSTNSIVQTFTSIVTNAAFMNRIWTRTLSGTTWSAWKLLGTDALNDLGLGLAVQAPVSAFDWQQADFVSGSQIVVDFFSSINPPAGITYATGTGVTIETVRVANGQATLRLTAHTGAGTNRREYLVFVNGAKGTRGFSVTQCFNSDSSTIIPVVNGGTGSSTAAGGLANLGGAPLASPALTGIPTAPTPAQTVNNTQIATTAFVKAALAALVNGSPAALDTLKELADALGGDANFSTTVLNALSGKQPIDPTLTALAGLVGSADRIPYFIGNDLMALADFTAFARTLLSRNSAALVRADLNIVSGPGWYKLGDLLIQYGTIDFSTSITKTINFPVRYPTKVEQVIVSDAGWGGGNMWGATEQQPIGFTAHVNTAGEGGQWISFGS